MPQRVHTAPRPSSPPGATEHAARTLGASVGPTRGHLAPRSAPFAPSRAHLAPLLAAGSLGLQRAAGLAPGCALRRPPLGHGWRAQHTQRLDHHQRRDQPAAAATQAQRRARTQLREEPAAARGLMLRLGASSAVGRLLAPRAPRVVHALPPDLAWGELRLSRGCVRARGGGYSLGRVALASCSSSLSRGHARAPAHTGTYTARARAPVRAWPLRAAGACAPPPPPPPSCRGPRGHDVGTARGAAGVPPLSRPRLCATHPRRLRCHRPRVRQGTAAAAPGQHMRGHTPTRSRRAAPHAPATRGARRRKHLLQSAFCLHDLCAAASWRRPRECGGRCLGQD